MKRTKLALATALAMISCASQAADVKLSGFVNAVMEVNNVGEDNGGTIDYDVINSTKVGMQADISINDKLSATFQVVNRQDQWANPETAERETTLEYGFLAYKTSEQTSLRLGRLRTPFFLMSEYLEVGAAVPWNKAPTSIYGQMPTNAFDGVDFLYVGEYGDLSYSSQVFMGQSDADVFLASVNSPVTVKMDSMYGGNVTLNYNDWMFRASYGHGDVSMTTDPVTMLSLNYTIEQLTAGSQMAFDGAQQAMDASAALAEIDPEQSAALALQAQELMTQGTQYAQQAGSLGFFVSELGSSYGAGITNLGLQGYITDNVLLMAEFSSINSENVMEGDDEGYYVALTYDFYNGYKVTGTFSDREQLRVNDTIKEEASEYILTVSKELPGNFLLRGEYRVTDKKSYENDVLGSDTSQDDFSISLNYIF